MTDPFGLERFVSAQAGTYQDALAQVRRGRKTGHWMWFVFPQVAGLGSSPMAQRYAVSGLDEASAYLAHRVLGPRLIEISAAAAETGKQRGAEEIFGGIDALKLRSSMTLFALAAPDEPVFGRVLDRFYGGRADRATLDIVGAYDLPERS
ncbi:DUF1810 domain-containing protein [Nigerium massiliense]|uniref:DUF1810 domain-containing protein n=1 Tax=Nigerium massiliense TaxID=1522317 RepID=UPI00058FA1FB|nr:DUF1810 domain-containing protein [Nigerium massiliense]